MSDRLPRANVSQVIKAIEKLGFVLVRQSGSHMIFKNNDGTRITVPYHSKQNLHPRIIKSIINDCKLSVEEFTKLLVLF